MYLVPGDREIPESTDLRPLRMGRRSFRRELDQLGAQSRPCSRSIMLPPSGALGGIDTASSCRSWTHGDALAGYVASPLRADDRRFEIASAHS